MGTLGRTFTWVAAVCLLASCKATDGGKVPSDPSASPAAVEAPLAAPSNRPATSATPSAAAVDLGEPSAGRAERLAHLAAMFGDHSEDPGSFFSDNYISNETSYLQVAEALEREVARGGAYVGVGPEQNFSYIALARPAVAYVVDLRRDNALLHLLYKALFERATSRAHFVASWTGRPYEPEGDPGAAARLDEVLAHAEKNAPDRSTFDAEHAAIVALLTETHGLTLSKDDRRSLEEAHRTFFDGQLDLRFKLQFNNGRRYPSLRELLVAEDPRGQQLGFLASEERFRFVQEMQREHRVIPVVGDFAGDRAMPAVAQAIERAGLTVSAFYVSNVEQYLFEGRVWDRWMRNVEALPTDARSLFIRAYLDQGRAHPRQMEGHRTATVLARIGALEERHAARPYTSFFEVATDRLLD